MRPAMFEHVNLTVTDPDKTAEILCQLFNWHIRWSGPAKDDGYTVHVGSETAYLALYKPKHFKNGDIDHRNIGKVNHLGILVNELDTVEKCVTTLGFKTFNHGDYEPGRRFYFMLSESIEAEVVSYSS
ncbi:MAG: VOC family protein [Alteromonadaceae bacterium]|uniref:Glyoxalase family protein n=2 Tax=Paraglaciecola mesophila TaxID=197222 RepID=K6Y0V9_9ALTE|nr:VOC family protein [Paraglaciecola mesophila]MAD15592.1 VOC family protein [Alteromonadaceae bacterium]GAC26474.1 glyoxalase family protein [Paraglaciecola mesophila KMM 241]|tara:strand:- start:54 stop:437 length:384 start_codon:yes stop_codon:yes gene_type:complete